MISTVRRKDAGRCPRDLERNFKDNFLKFRKSREL